MKFTVVSLGKNEMGVCQGFDELFQKRYGRYHRYYFFHGTVGERSVNCANIPQRIPTCRARTITDDKTNKRGPPFFRKQHSTVVEFGVSPPGIHSRDVESSRAGSKILW
ncbi:hypothetical protein HJC23_012907 [Cyclotella cryptica]|uniref:LAGLIDADG homing endonuclease n=1 Tax=Cyclotella cryptica TaxID=29204 RepID=A0ABD3Q1G2_9STRA